MNLSTPPTSRQPIANNDNSTYPVWYLWFNQIYAAILGQFNNFTTKTNPFAGNITLDTNTTSYFFSGTTATWILPSVSKNQDVFYIIKNRGSGNLTVQTTGTDRIYTTSAVASVVVTAGSALRLQSDGTYWNSI